jgi:phage shock protein C
MDKRLYRSRSDRMISGVCGGIADYFGIDPTIVRLATVALLFVTSGAVILIYIVMAIVVPEQPAEGEPDSPRAMTSEEISAGARGFGRDVQTAANKIVGGTAGGAAAASGAGPTEAAATATDDADASADVAESPVSSREPAAAPGPDAPSPETPAPSAPATSGRRSTTTGALLIGVLLIAFGLLVFVQRAVGVDFMSVVWRLFVPGVIILLGVLILLRALRKG